VVVRAASMRDLHGIMAAIADALWDAGARLFETGDSHNSVQCLIAQEFADAAERRLCERFQLSADMVTHGSVNEEAAE
jgi:aspartate kinase